MSRKAMKSIRYFPIMGGPAVPWKMIEPHERQAERNHNQTLERLAERGGLDCSEAICVLNDCPLDSYDPEFNYRQELIGLIEKDQTERVEKYKQTLRNIFSVAQNGAEGTGQLRSIRNLVREAKVLEEES